MRTQPNSEIQNIQPKAFGIKSVIVSGNVLETIAPNYVKKLNILVPKVAGYTPLNHISLRSISNGMTVSGVSLNDAKTSIDVTAVNLRTINVDFNEITLFVLYVTV